jgi:phospho-N-acetylmuramoyl-pentapeptide-transferase
MKIAIMYFLISFAVALLVSPLVLAVLRRLRAGQTILHYVDFHKSKGGTPTMGGFIFILPLCAVVPFILGPSTPLANIVVIASIGYALLGFLDDFIKIRGKKNLGLRAYQKIIGQGGIAVLVSVFYYLANPDGRIFIPFFNVFLDIGFWILPLVFLALIATTNSVNLTDGLDGLAGSVSAVYFLFLGGLIALVGQIFPIPEAAVFTQIAAIACGALLCFLLLNTNKASVFMGDTGSLYLGSLIALLSLFSFLGLYLIVLGIVFVLSSVSDIIQVIYFKATKGKRVFLMAPFHHHLEKKGWAEAKIVMLYVAVTIISGLICVWTLL